MKPVCYNLDMRKSTSGFTIVELLIVIVVVAILAAISVVAYNGIQGRANDSAVKNDLANFAKRIRLLEADTGVMPPGGAIRSGGADTGTNYIFPGVTFPPSKNAYDKSINNLYYCTGTITANGQKSFRIYAGSKSGTTFRYSSENGLESLGTLAFSSTTCVSGYNDGASWTYGYNNTSGWLGWTN